MSIYTHMPVIIALGLPGAGIVTQSGKPEHTFGLVQLSTGDVFRSAVVRLDVDDEAMVERISGHLTCGTGGEGYYATCKRASIDSACDTCGLTEFRRCADDTAGTVRRRLVAYCDKVGALRCADAINGIGVVAQMLLDIVRPILNTSERITGQHVYASA